MCGWTMSGSFIGRGNYLRRSSGFTLIEILIVIAILGILMGVLATQFLPFLVRGKEYETRAILQQIRTSIDLYEHEQGDFPPSDFTKLDSSSPNSINLGAESLAVSLFSPDFPSNRPDEKWLVNTDADQSEKIMTELGSRELFEVADAWGNPIAYIHHRNYGEKFFYRVLDSETGLWEDVEIKAAQKDEKGVGFHKPQDYQLISAGADGKFFTDDDLTNFQ